MVQVDTVAIEELQAHIQRLKEQGKRILALSPHKLKRTSPRSLEMTTLEYTVVSQ